MIHSRPLPARDRRTKAALLAILFALALVPAALAASSSSTAFPVKLKPGDLPKPKVSAAAYAAFAQKTTLGLSPSLFPPVVVDTLKLAATAGATPGLKAKLLQCLKVSVCDTGHGSIVI